MSTALMSVISFMSLPKSAPTKSLIIELIVFTILTAIGFISLISKIGCSVLEFVEFNEL